jgi:hypothetical protein
MAGDTAIIPEIDEGEDDLVIEPPPQSFGKVVSRHRTAKNVTTGAMGVAGLGVQGAQLGTGVSVAGVVAGTAGTIGTGGALLLIGGGVLTVAGSGLAMRSAYRTNRHIDNLKMIHQQRKTYTCESKGSIEHDYIGGVILPYIIRKKRSKLHRKVAQVAPGVSALEKIRAVGKNLYKRSRGTLGKNRTFAAEWLARHLITHDCGLAEAIVSELYSPEEMEWLKTQDNDVVAPLLAEKMKSV